MGRSSRRFAQRTPGGRQSKYGLTGVPRNSRISVDFDKYRRNLPEFRKVGTIVSRVGSICAIQWDDDPDITQYPEGDVRYWVDTGRARITPPKKKTVFDTMTPNEG